MSLDLNVARIMKRGLRAIIFITTLLHAGFFFQEDKKTTERMPPPMDIVYEKNEAFHILNERREAMGMNTLSWNDTLSDAAQNHAAYLVKNHLHLHDEDPEREGFTGIAPVDRAWKSGYASSWVLENLSTQNIDARDSIDGLLGAIYHRFAFLDISIDEIGIGLFQKTDETRNSAFVYLMGNSSLNALCYKRPFSGYGKYVYKVCQNQEHKVSRKEYDKAKESNVWLNPEMILYPYDGQRNVPPAFYSEIPDPLPDYEVSGFPVSVTFNRYFFDKVDIRSFELYDQHEKSVVPVRILDRQSDPHKHFNAYQYALFPLKRLEYDSRYHVHISYIVNKEEKQKDWYFYTRKPKEKMFKITEKEATVKMKRGESYLLYLVPLDGHDIVKDVTFPDDIDLTFMDNNTLRIKTISESSDDFTLHCGKHTVHIDIID